MFPCDEEVEVSPGFFIERRSVLSGLGGVLLGLMSGAESFAALSEGTDEDLSFDQFLAQANPLAQSLVGDVSASGQDRYLRSIAALASKLHNIPIPGKWNDTDQGETPESYRIGFNPGGDPFKVLHWRLEPGAICRPHAHTYGNVVSIGIEGLIRVRNYEVVGGPDYEFGGTFLIRRTVDQLLGPGSVNLVSLARNYIHGFDAGPDGARGLDITTPLKPRPAHSTPYLSIGKTPVDEFHKTYEASWIYGK
jgi:quercetin dioxygenase-like cupin family protein